MKRYLILIILLCVIAGCKNPRTTESKTTPEARTTAMKIPINNIKDGILIHMSSGYDNPHRALMPLKMALMMSKGKDVALYLDVDAVKLVLKDSKDLDYSDFPSLKDMLKQLIKANVLIMVCPTCLKVAGKSPSDLIPGVVVTQKEKFFNFSKGKIATLDY